MTPSEQMNLLNLVEEKFPVEKWKVGEVEVWPRLRQILADELQKEKTEDNHGKKRSFRILDIGKKTGIFFFGLLRFLWFSMADMSANQSGKGLGTILYYSQANRRVLFGKTFQDRYCGPLIDFANDFGFSTMALESAPNHQYRIPRANKSRYIQPFLDIAVIKGRFFSRIEDDINLEGYGEFLAFLESKQYRIPQVEMDYVLRLIREMNLLIELFLRWLISARTKLVVLHSYNTNDGMSLVTACAKLNIPAIDIQQGWQGKEYYGTARWKKVPIKGYASLPKYFWVWSDQERTVIDAWNSNVRDYHKAVVGGDAWLAQWKNQLSQITVAHMFPILEYLKKEKDSGKKIVVLSLQLGYEIPSFVHDVMSSTRLTHTWLIRAHPAMLSNLNSIVADYLPIVGNTKLIRDVSLAPLPIVLGAAQLHVTMFSSTLIEAKKFGLRTILVDNLGADIFPDEIQNKNAFLGTDFTTFRDLVCAPLSYSQTDTAIQEPNPEICFKQILFDEGLL